jgi:hypothetical protein
MDFVDPETQRDHDAFDEVPNSSSPSNRPCGARSSRRKRT